MKKENFSSAEIMIAVSQSKKERKFWLDNFSGEWIKSCFPYDHTGKSSIEGECRLNTAKGHLTGALFERLMALRNGSDPRLHMIMAASVVLLLSRYTGNHDIIIGMPIDRQEKGGLFVNTVLALRNQVNVGCTFKDLLLQVKDTIDAAIENQNYPIEGLLNDLNLTYNDDDFPLFDAAVLLENIHDITYLRHINNNISFIFKRTVEEIEILIEYNRAFYKEATIKRIISNLLQLLNESVFNVNLRLSSINILAEEEKRSVLYDFNNTKCQYSRDTKLNRLFEEQAARTPDNLAAMGREPGIGTGHSSLVSVTYGELNRKSNQLARELKKYGIKSNRFAALIMERSIEMVIGVMAILKAGGAYVPLEPYLPKARIKKCLSMLNVECLLTNSTQLSGIDKISKELPELKNIFCLDAIDWAGVSSNKLFKNKKLIYPGEIDRNPGENPLPVTVADDIAYVIFTSGTTGIPKGVIETHRPVVNLIEWVNNTFKVCHSDKLLFIASLSFDLSVYDIFGILAAGASIYVVGSNVIKLPDRLLKIIFEEGITFWDSAPAALQLLVPNIQDLKKASSYTVKNTLRLVFLSGDWIPVTLPDILKEAFAGVKVIGLGGGTEATIWSNYYPIDKVMPQWKSIPYGKPIQNAKYYILDQDLNPCPIGVPGDLYIGGECLSSGYINEIRLTTEKFINNPFVRGEKIYKTGDMARWFTDGNMEFLGRQDNQVKIRGFRIELGEIESSLLKHKDIKEAVALARKNKSGDRYLCAYIVSGRRLKMSELREYLSQELPDYMLPSYFVTLDAFPLTPNGKIDYKSLPAPEGLNLEIDSEYIEPRNNIELKLAEIWGTVLGRNSIGINDNFFFIGGDSIKSIQILSRMNQAGYKIEMRELFRYPTIAGLAPRVKKFEDTSEQLAIEGKIPLTPVQEWFFEKHRIDIHHFNQSVMLYSRDGFDEDIIKAVFTKIQDHHDALRITYHKEENRGFIQVNHGLDYPLSLPVFDLRNRENTLKVLEAKANDIQASIHLEKGPLMKLGLFHLDDGDRLVIAIHHLVIDAFSWRILFEDIQTLYRQYKKGEQPALPLKTDSFKVWAEKLSDYANSEAFLKERVYWAELESTNLSSIEYDFDEKDNFRKDAAVLSFNLAEKETDELLTKVNGAFGTEINDILLTAIGMGIHRTWGHNRILIFLEGHGREEIIEGIDISRTVGWFTSGYPLVLDISHENEPGHQVKQVKEAIRKIPNKGIGYGILKYLTSKKHKKDIEFKLNPQIGFNYLGQFDSDIEQMSFEIAKESAGITMSRESKRELDFDISGRISNNRLGISITYNKKHYKKQNMEVLLNNTRDELKKIIAFCCSKENTERTPGDFTYKGLSIETIDRLMKEYPGIEDIYTLTPMQEGMLFHALVDERSYSYFEQASYRLKGELDVSLVEKSLNELIKRHDILRTSFIYNDIERPVQVVLKDRRADFFYQDVRKVLEPGKKENFIREFKAKDKACSFDLAKGALMRVSVIQIDRSEYDVIWSFHHILMDGWCLGILNNEFFEIYNGYLKNKPQRLQGVKPYRNYIQWLENQDKETSRSYWAIYLDSYEDAAGILKSNKIKGSEKGYKNKHFSFVLNQEKIKSLNELAGRNHVTLNTIIQAIWGIVLGRYVCKQDVVFGAVVSGRPSEIDGVETMVGLFINTIPVRIRWKDRTTLNELLQQVQRAAIDSEPHHYYPLAEIQSGSALKQNLLDHILIFENYPITEELYKKMDGRSEKNGRFKLELLGVDVFEQTNYDFNLIIIPGEQLTLKFDYNANAYDDDLISIVANHFNQVLIRFLNDPGQDVEKLSILSKEEKKQILFNFNDMYAEYPRDKTINELFEEQVERIPDNIALIGQIQNSEPQVPNKEGAFGVMYLTYKELNEMSDHLAYLLHTKNVKPDTIVGIMMERSFEMIIGIMGILKAGGAYLPIDPEYPEERIAYMLADSRANVFITAGPTGTLVKRVETDMEIVFLNSSYFYELFSTSPLTLPASNNSKMAYIIYTSGSMGKPKGVMVEHASIVNTLIWRKDYYGFNENDTALQISSFSFDSSITEIFTPLISGSELVLIFQKQRLDLEYLAGIIKWNSVTHFIIVPNLYKKFLDEISGSLTGLRAITVAGESFTEELVNDHFEKLNHVELHNEYGPTENSVCTTVYKLSSRKTSVLIGKPINNTTCYILDRKGRLNPIRVPGELYIGGQGLSRGYLNRPELTKKRFVEQVAVESDSCICINKKLFAGVSRGQEGSFFKKYPSPRRKQKIYQTGDLARWLPDGNLEFLGRIDHQVKIRGYRIEMEEIEYRLSEIDYVKNAVVIAKEKEGGEKFLCAYIVADKELVVPEIKDFFAAALPDYMMPSYFVQLQDIPLTNNGKVDRKTLDSYGLTGNLGVEYVAPETGMEKLIADIWKKVLKVDRVGVYDNFFDIGGHSLSMITMRSKLKKMLNKDIPIADMFGYPTISSLADYFNQSEKGELTAEVHEKIDETVGMMDEATDVLFADEIDKN